MQAKMNSKLAFGNRLWVLAIAFVVIFFVVSISLSYRAIGVMEDNNQQVASSLQILNLIKDLRMNVVRAENSLRGYILTENENYLTSFGQAIYSVDELLLSLMTTKTTLEVQKQRFENVYQLSGEKSAAMRRTVDLIEENNKDVLIAAMEQQEIDGLTAQLKKLIEDMEADEMLLLYKNRLEAQNNRRFILISLVVTNTVGLLLSLLMFLLVYRNSRKVRSLYEEIEKSNVELESKVRERTNALEIYADELQRSNRELEDFAFVASHDLQEPLRKIRAFGDRLLQKSSDSLGERGADYVFRMHAASERMSHLIDDLLSFSRVSTKQNPFELVSLDSVFGAVKEDLEYAIESTNASIECDSLPTIEADASQLRQVFMNLIGNSLKFKRADLDPVVKITCEINVPCDEASEHDGTDHDAVANCCYIHFQDNGIGFEQQYADRVFNLFQRLHGRDEYAGTGIGLALCRKIIERHGGSINVVSEPGKGSLFTIKLPMTHPDVETITDLSSEGIS